MQLLSICQFKCWTNGVYLSRDRKILYYYDDKYQIQRISRLRLLTSECGVQYRNTTYAPANHHFSSSSFLFTETFFLSSILWYLLKQFPFALSFISARVDILNFYYVLSILVFLFFRYCGRGYSLFTHSSAVCDNWLSSFYYHKFAFNLFCELRTEYQFLIHLCSAYGTHLGEEFHLILRIRTVPQLEIATVWFYRFDLEFRFIAFA